MAKKAHPKKRGKSATGSSERSGNGAATSDGFEEAAVAESAAAESLEQRLAQLEQELEELRAQADEYQDRLLRSQAELQNVLKRHERDRAERARYAAEPLARDLLPVVDDLERAVSHAGEGSGNVVEGVELVLKGLLAVLERHGVERIKALGEPFDPNQHEAVQMVESAEKEPNTVIEEHRAGYRLHDRLLRPAMVAVARAPAAADAAEGGKNGE
ncbi:MAG: nucleotide exchange factor GrpE [Deltaproteobacteria bacterium]|nr:MAG: nucleotide exchange factor GrpE [Deltaproteobacteria bacterium]